QDLKYFAKIAKSLNMTALVEVHSLEELERVLAIEEINLIGINNRDLTDFSVDLQTTVKLISAKKAELATRDILIVSESGIFTKDDIDLVKNAGAGAVLIGESFMKQPEPGEALQALF
ncbi:MAG: indole-3-glycerol phosphate synthase TrpC, partial [Microcoleaceae cyanobacterium]